MNVDFIEEMWVWMRIEKYLHCCCCCFWVFFLSLKETEKSISSLQSYTVHIHRQFWENWRKIVISHTEQSNHKKQKLSKRGWDEFLEFQRIVRRRIRVRRKERRNLPNPQWERSPERRTYVFFEMFTFTLKSSILSTFNLHICRYRVALYLPLLTY